MLEEKDLQKLLRLKRYEKPADPAYFDRFLTDFQRRQREDVVKTPLSTLIAERVTGFFAELQVPRMAYAGALGAFAVLAAGVFILPDSLQNSNALPQPTAIASKSPSKVFAYASSDSMLGGPSDNGIILDGVTLPEPRATYASHESARNTTPRYVLDARPTSYDPPFSF